MSEHLVPAANWHMALVDFIEDSQDGDTIVVLNDGMKQLAERAKQRMCPDKRLSIVVKGGEEDVSL